MSSLLQLFLLLPLLWTHLEETNANLRHESPHQVMVAPLYSARSSKSFDSSSGSEPTSQMRPRSEEQQLNGNSNGPNGMTKGQSMKKGVSKFLDNSRKSLSDLKSKKRLFNRPESSSSDSDSENGGPKNVNRKNQQLAASIQAAQYKIQSAIDRTRPAFKDAHGKIQSAIDPAIRDAHGKIQSAIDRAGPAFKDAHGKIQYAIDRASPAFKDAHCRILSLLEKTRNSMQAAPGNIRTAIERTKSNLQTGNGRRTRPQDQQPDKMDIQFNFNSPKSSPKTRKTINVAFTDKRGTLRTLDKWPIVYCKDYNIQATGYEYLLSTIPYDIQKFTHIMNFLTEAGMLTEDSVCEPEEADEKILLTVHSQKYLESLTWRSTIVDITNITYLWAVSNKHVQNLGLKPLRFHIGGSILAGELALHRGWAINTAGGFSHASAKEGGGFCFYADITILIKWLFTHYPQKVQTVMIIDLDAQQCNGPETDFRKDDRVFIVDVYNKDVYPNGGKGNEKINIKVELESGTTDDTYLEIVEQAVDAALNFNPSIVIYNAGTDCISGDSHGQMNISMEGIIERDQIVFSKVRALKIPIVMLTGGGYLHKSAEVVAKSILNLYEKGLISK